MPKTILLADDSSTIRKIVVEGNSLDAVAEGQFVPEGTTIRVVQLQGNRIVVRGLHLHQKKA